LATTKHFVENGRKLVAHLNCIKRKLIELVTVVELAVSIVRSF